ncbi:phospholipid scramblase 1 isoform X2 [Phascolarctos cinereus]|uniref:Phospholipid scramblase n=2 Tax=Phascolarctos cinereus TaxID=38626 RepID=A0A6P5JWR7_PHACI|nr:phospholipid scramblase 1 isoform X1 [Phascolarctos cinereus]
MIYQEMLAEGWSMQRLNKTRRREPLPPEAAHGIHLSGRVSQLTDMDKPGPPRHIGHPAPRPIGFPADQRPPAFFHQPQPGTTQLVQWAPAPPPPLNCPPGLEYLTQIDQLLIHQQVELLEALTGFETNNRYAISNSFGQRVYFAVEENDCCTRNCCGNLRPFIIKILDNTGREVITFDRPFRCVSCFYPCCLQQLEIQSPPGVPIGYITQNWHPFLPKFTVLNEHHQEVLKIQGPCIVCRCCADVDFDIKSLNEQTTVGKITKQWTGIIKETFTDADNFAIQFPLDLDVKMKAVMLGACFLIDFMFFEHGGSSDSSRTGVWQ